MDHDNPYRAPQDLSPPAPVSAQPLTLSGALRFVLKSAVIFAAAGAMLGVLIGIGVPHYYRQVFDAVGDPTFKPPLAGLLLGFMQGGLAGILAGLAMLALVVWSGSKTRKA